MTLEHLDTAIAFAVVMLAASLILTIVTQTISALFGYRGAQLKWALKTLITGKYLGTESLVSTKALVQRILTDDRISDSILSGLDDLPLIGGLFQRWTRASAIRFDEFVDVLKQITDTTAPAAPKKAAVSGVAQEVAAVAAGAVARAAEAPKDTAARLIAAAGILQADQLVEAKLQELHRWFDATMDRASQRFAVCMRVWTVLFAIVIAFAAHLDAFRLYSQLSNNSELRARLIASADALTNKAGEIISTDGKDVPAAYAEAMRDLQEKDGRVKALGTLPNYGTQQQFEDWLRNGLKGKSDARNLIAEYELLVQTRLKTAMERLQNQATSLNELLQKNQVQLWPEPYPRDWDHDNIWGILVCAGLLSLGAPFWFNTLKDLMNFRSTVARKEKDEAHASSTT
jgi:hypothetical protein